MFLDASAMIAIIASESDAASLAARPGQAALVVTSPIAVYEAVPGLARVGNTSIADATAVLDQFLAEVDAIIMPVDAHCGREAIAAFERFGKGRHPAALNLGDCFAYACAATRDVPCCARETIFRKPTSRSPEHCVLRPGEHRTGARDLRRLQPRFAIEPATRGPTVWPRSNWLSRDPNRDNAMG